LADSIQLLGRFQDTTPEANETRFHLTGRTTAYVDFPLTSSQNEQFS
jgi:hypothetical protein